MSDKLPDTKKDLLQARISARGLLSNPSRPPSFTMSFVKPRFDESGAIIQPPIKMEPAYARFGMNDGQIVEREKGETVEAFVARVEGMRPMDGQSHPIILFPRENSAETAPDVTH
jgi:hypothetical protein